MKKYTFLLFLLISGRCFAETIYYDDCKIKAGYDGANETRTRTIVAEAGDTLFLDYSYELHSSSRKKIKINDEYIYGSLFLSNEYERKSGSLSYVFKDDGTYQLKLECTLGRIDDYFYITNIQIHTCDGLVRLYDDKSYLVVKEINYKQINYSRIFNNNSWQALYVPFRMNYEDWCDEYTIARINDVHQFDDDDDGEIDRTELEVIKIKSGVTESNTPYLIKAKTTGEKIITVENTTLYMADENSFNVSSWNSLFTFTGTYHTITGSEMVANGYYALGNGTLHQAESEENSLGTFRWYMTVTDRQGNPKSNIHEVKVKVFGEDEDTFETGVVSFDNSPSSIQCGDVFDLSGRKVSYDTKRKGVYIKNGKKYFVK